MHVKRAIELRNGLMRELDHIYAVARGRGYTLARLTDFTSEVYNRPDYERLPRWAQTAVRAHGDLLFRQLWQIVEYPAEARKREAAGRPPAFLLTRHRIAIPGHTPDGEARLLYCSALNDLVPWVDEVQQLTGWERHRVWHSIESATCWSHTGTVFSGGWRLADEDHDGPADTRPAPPIEWPPPRTSASERQRTS